MLVAIAQDDGEIDLALLCAVCKQPFRSLIEAFVAHIRPTNGVPLETKWGHRRCFDGNFAQVFGTPEVRLWRGDFALRMMFSRWRQYEMYKMYT
jgi:hypothetical protein